MSWYVGRATSGAHCVWEGRMDILTAQETWRWEQALGAGWEVRVLERLRRDEVRLHQLLMPGRKQTPRIKIHEIGHGSHRWGSHGPHWGPGAQQNEHQNHIPRVRIQESVRQN